MTLTSFTVVSSYGGVSFSVHASLTVHSSSATMSIISDRSTSTAGIIVLTQLKIYLKEFNIFFVEAYF